MATVAACGALVFAAEQARACGCFAPPDPSVPVVQAGERILFSVDAGVITAHIQIQYAGNAAEFGWILPLPSIPTLELGTDELFTQLIATTQPKYRLNRVYEGECSFDPNRFSNALGGGDASAAPAASEGADNGPLVFKSSIGPYDYAVLKADDKNEMLGWLASNRYFVPVGTEDVVGPYIRPGAYFLALKLQSGQSAGDLQPVVVRYPSDLPMIPIVLTSVAAQPDMGIQVWMLGAARAIPRNYYHTVLNDTKIDWFSGGQNYNDLVIAATREAPDRHSFVTEYAGPSAIMRNVLNAPRRFGSIAELAMRSTAHEFLQYLFDRQYPFTSQLITILSRYIPIPAEATSAGLQPADYYQTYASCGRNAQCWGFPLPEVTEDHRPAEMAKEIEERIVKPTLAAGQLFDKHPKLTRLYTTLSPEDMDRDPVFSFNPALPDLSNVHEATLTYHCGLWGWRDQGATPATLKTAAGWSIDYPDGTGEGGEAGPIVVNDGPGTERLEVLSEEGAPLIQFDNGARIKSLVGSSGCSFAPGGRRGSLATTLFALMVLIALRARRANDISKDS
jgi:hypothetical protein